MTQLEKLEQVLKKSSSKKRAAVNAWFFKTGHGQYGYGDRFIGITVPQLRAAIKSFNDLPHSSIQVLLDSPIHEYRLAGLLILVSQFKKAPARGRKRIFNFYLRNYKRVNNWDLVDASAPSIVGEYLLSQPRTVLYQLAKSADLWKRRIAIVATYAFIKNNQFSDTLKISELLLNDSQDLIHKAVGWMLREVGKRDKETLEQFLLKNIKKLPRTALRYSIERFPERERKKFLAM